MATAKTDAEDGSKCPLCLSQFNIPRQLPCAHNFCQSCLQSYITTEATKCNELRHIKCPICTQLASPSIKDRPKSEWASLFPVNKLLESMLPAKLKADSMCDSCNSENVSVLAEGFCAVCKEAMCKDCLKFHRRQKMTKNHAIVSVQEFDGNPQNVLKLGEDLCCFQHEGEYIKFYCKDHKVAGCGTCFFRHHSACSNKIDLKEEVPALLREIKPEAIISDMEKVESHLQKWMEMNESSVSNLKSQVTKITNIISEIRRKINSLLDDLEKRLKTEGSRIYKEEDIRKQEENHKCLSLIHAVRNSRVLFNTVYKYGSEIQQFMMAAKMVPQIHSYLNLVREKFEMTDRLTVKVDLVPQLESILSQPVAEVGKLVPTRSSNVLPLCVLEPLPLCLRKPIKDCHIEQVNVIDVNVPNVNNPCYYGVTFLPRDRVMLVDHYSKQCTILSSSYKFITSHTLTASPFDICVTGDLEVAVSLFNGNTIQILSIKDDIISSVRTITTNCMCQGIAAAGTGNMAVIGNCDGQNGCWILMSTKGKVKASYQYDYLYGSYNYIALNNANTRVYVSVYEENYLHCFDMKGQSQFTYSLTSPLGVAVDRDDNIYILGYGTSSIHQLSPDGSALQVITIRAPGQPCAISFNKRRDMFIITSYCVKKLLVFELK